MLFSGLGDVEKAQETLSVGVGALAGSTIMLLTVPWGLSVYNGKVNFSGPDMQPNYKGNRKLVDDSLTCGSFSSTGVSLTAPINLGAKMMMVTTLPYFLIQIPAFFLSGDRATISQGEHSWAMAGFVLCMGFFVAYMFTQVKMSNDTAHKLKRMAVIKESLKKGAISLSGALTERVNQIESQSASRGETEVSHLVPLDGNDDCLKPSEEVKTLLKNILSEAFHGYDQDKNGLLSKVSIRCSMFALLVTIPNDRWHRYFLMRPMTGFHTIIS